MLYHRLDTLARDTLAGIRAKNPAITVLLQSIRVGIGTGHTVLDVGCGRNSPLQFLWEIERVGIDGYAPDLESAKRRRTHGRYILGDVRTVLPRLKNCGYQADACVCLDVIEHLTRDEGMLLLENMEAIAPRVIIMTPNGFLPQEHEDSDDLQEHHSGWTAADFQSRGYRVYGMLGPRQWRGERARMLRRPKLLWAPLSLLWPTNSHTAFSILAIKVRPECDIRASSTKGQIIPCLQTPGSGNGHALATDRR